MYYLNINHGAYAPKPSKGTKMNFLTPSDFLPASIPSNSIEYQLFRRVILHVGNAQGDYRHGLTAKAFASLKMAQEAFECMSSLAIMNMREADSHDHAADIEARFEAIRGAWSFVDSLVYFVRREAEDAARACRVD
jgi:hypothetical protein